MKLRNRLNWPLTGFAVLLLAGNALAAQTPTVFTVVVDAVAAAKTPLYLAVDRGIFKKYGLDARVVYVRGATLAVQAGIGGEADVLDAD
jgi:ABC-type nitrate/sulfonate/bicarbonate transport system substrate-binding protein